MRVSIIAAVADNGVIGLGGDLPWRLPADLARFKQLTTGHALVMGRRSFESIGRPLPGRRSWVLSRDPEFRPEGVRVASSLEDALGACAAETEVFVGGGASVYQEALRRAERAYITRVHARPDGDTFFPDPEMSGWRLLEEERREADERNPHALSFCIYEAA